MLNVILNETEGLAILEPNGNLSKKDFELAAEIINPLIEKFGKLNGIIIHVKAFPYWDSFSSLIAHFKFIKDHHKNISKIAFVTDSGIGTFAEKVAAHFVQAEIRHFAFNEIEVAQNWIINS